MSFRSVLILAALAVPASLALAESPLSDPDSLPKVSCTNIHYSNAFLKKYPKAPAACQEGRVANGETYGKFTAKVYLNGDGITTVNMLNVSGDPVTTFSFKAKPGAQVIVNGKSEAISDLKPGEQITFWVSEKRMQASAMPGATADSWRVMPPVSK
jgi:hypothetical protein